VNPLKFFLGLAGAAIAIMLVTFVACDKPSQSEIHNRVPALPQSTADAQKAAQDAQNAAASAQAALKEIQDAAAKKPEQPAVQYSTDGTAMEHTNAGRVLDVTEIWEAQSESNYGEAYMAFTFVEESGFQKRFYPVCSDQVIQTSKTSILYHWAPNQNSGKHNQKGCFKIDGYIQKGQ
jgi:hypothetical protein